MSPVPEPDSVQDQTALAAPISVQATAPLTTRGKFLFAGAEKFYVRGVTYGAFRPDAAKNEYTDLAQIDHDFAQMAESGINAVRIPHTMPPRALLDVAAAHGLRVMVGLSAEQYAGYLIDTQKRFDIAAAIRTEVQTCAGHPALLRYRSGASLCDDTTLDLGPNGFVRLGAYALVNGARIFCDEEIEIGDHALVSWDVVLMDAYRAPSLRDDHARPIRLGRNCWVGFGACVLPGVRIGEGSIVAARSVVAEEVPDYVVVAGNPARIVRELPRVSADLAGQQGPPRSSS